MHARSILSLLASAALATATLLQPRDLCAQIEDTLEIDLAGQKIVFGELDICLCIGLIPDLLNVNLVAKVAAELAGVAAVTDRLHVMIDGGRHVDSCPTGIFPSARKRSPAEIARRDHKCDTGLTKCGIYSGFPHPSSPSSSSDFRMVGEYECLDTQSNLESCGGCVTPYTLGLTAGEISRMPTGVDCTAIPGVSDVSCQRGQCVVDNCRKGYTLVLDEEEDAYACVPTPKGHGFKAHHHGHHHQQEEEEMHKAAGGWLVWGEEAKK